MFLFQRPNPSETHCKGQKANEQVVVAFHDEECFSSLLSESATLRHCRLVKVKAEPIGNDFPAVLRMFEPINPSACDA